MKLEIEGRTFERVTAKVDAPEGGRLMWRFNTPDEKVMRLWIDRRIKRAREALDTDTQAVRVYSLLWPVAELAAEIGRQQSEEAKAGLARGFIEKLIYLFDNTFDRAIPGLKKVQGHRAPRQGDPPDTCKTPPTQETVKAVLEILKKCGATPSHTACETTLDEMAQTLKEAELLPDGADTMEVNLVVKRLALKYDTITPTPDRNAAAPRFAPMHADSVEYRLFEIYKADAVRDRREDKADADGYGFQGFLRGAQYVAIVEGWPRGYNHALPVIDADAEPQDDPAAEPQETDGAEPQDDPAAEPQETDGAEPQEKNAEAIEAQGAAPQEPAEEIGAGWKHNKLSCKHAPVGRKPALFKFGEKDYTVPSGEAWKVVCTMIKASAFDTHGIPIESPSEIFRRDHREFFIERMAQKNGHWFLRTR